jgi:LacI family transcriptional regulator
MNMNSNPRILLTFDWYDYRTHQGIITFAKEKEWDLFCIDKVSEEGLNFTPAILPYTNLKFDGAISLINSTETAGFFMKNKIPVVDLGPRDFGLKIPRVLTDNRVIGELAAEHFLERGFSNFYVPNHYNIKVLLERFESFQNHLKKNGGYKCQLINYPNRNNRNSGSNNYHSKKSSSLLFKEGLKNVKFPAALFAYNDNIAAKWMMLAKHFGIQVPDQLAILGADNNPLIVEAFSPSLSSIETDLEGLGYHTARLLSYILDGKEKIEKKIIFHDPISVVTRRSTDTVASKNETVSKALKLINQDLTINAFDLAKQLGVTQQGLQHLFREHFHLSPAQTIRHLRIREIKHLLMDKNMKMKTIAKSTGYPSMISFSQFFKRETGMTPGQYRKNISND